VNRLRKGDEIIVIAGRDKGKRGRVLRLVGEDRALVDGINVVQRHTRPNPQRGVTGGILKKETPIHVSNVALYNPVTKKAGRIGYKTLEDGRKVRFFRETGEVLDTK